MHTRRIEDSHPRVFTEVEGVSTALDDFRATTLRCADERERERERERESARRSRVAVPYVVSLHCVSTGRARARWRGGAQACSPVSLKKSTSTPTAAVAKRHLLSRVLTSACFPRERARARARAPPCSGARKKRENAAARGLSRRGAPWKSAAGFLKELGMLLREIVTRGYSRGRGVASSSGSSKAGLIRSVTGKKLWL